METRNMKALARRRQQGGFTLIEIAIVLAIIGLLIAALSAARGIQESAEQDRAVQWMLGWVAGAEDYERRYGPLDFDEDAIGAASINNAVNIPDSNINVDDNDEFAFGDNVIGIEFDSGGEFGGDQNYITFTEVRADLIAELDRQIDGAVDGTSGRVQGHGVTVDDINTENYGSVEVAIPPIRENLD